MIRGFEKEDFDEINGWRKSRHVAVVPYDFYPRNGLIDPNVAAGFLILTNTGVALLDHFVTNPEAHQKDRRRSILAIAIELEAVAKQMGYRYVLALTKHKGIGHTCIEDGFESLGDCMMFGKEI